MGTRHLIAVQLDGEYKIAQYGQWDGYYEGQGTGVLEFLSTQMNVQLFKARLRKCSYSTRDEILATYNEFGGLSADGSIEYSRARAHDAKHPSISRDTGSDILRLVQDSDTPPLLKNSIDFAGDSLFCEYAYVIDLDKNTFEVFRGFNKEPLAADERFANAPRDKRPDGSVSEYYPVKKVAEFDLKKLPSEKVFIEVCNATEKEEE